MTTVSPWPRWTGRAPPCSAIASSMSTRCWVVAAAMVSGACRCPDGLSRSASTKVTVPIGKLKATAEPLTSSSRRSRLPPRNTSSTIPAWSIQRRRDNIPRMAGPLVLAGPSRSLRSRPPAVAPATESRPFRGPPAWLTHIRQMADVRARGWGHDLRVEINLVPAQPFTQQSAPPNLRQPGHVQLSSKSKQGRGLSPNRS